MTPKEKAKELFDKFYIEVLDRDGTSSMHGVEAKQCALIAIDEQIKLYNELNESGLLLPNSFGFELHEIKTELEKL